MSVLSFGLKRVDIVNHCWFEKNLRLLFNFINVLHAEEFSVTEMMLWSQKKTALFWLSEVNYKLTINWKVSLKPKKISISRESKYNKESCIGPVSYYWISPN